MSKDLVLLQATFRAKFHSMQVCYVRNKTLILPPLFIIIIIIITNIIVIIIINIAIIIIIIIAIPHVWTYWKSFLHIKGGPNCPYFSVS